MNMNKLIKDWEIYALSEELSRKSVTIYKKNILEFTEWLDKDITKVSVKDIRRFKVYIRDEENGKGLSARSFNQYKSALNSFFKFLCEEEYCLGNPVSMVSSAKYKDEGMLKPRLNIIEARSLLKIARNMESKNATRYYAVLQILCKLGLRVEEIEKLDLNQIKSDIWAIKVKGGTTRIINLEFLPEVKSAIEDYLVDRPETTEKALFIGERGNRFSISGIQNMVKSMGKKINRPDIFPHIFRAMLSDSVFDYTRDTTLSQLVIGHKVNLVVHKHYTDPATRARIASETVRKVFDNFKI